MTKAPFNIQDQFLNQSRKERVKISLKLLTGDVIEGYIKSFDNFSILLEVEADILIYKHSVATLTPTDGQFRLHQ
ncbi:MAG: RNA chaperone Hfq [Deltaproteobacteria bacterium HGW-Deltaproteobacteria-23]|jgi:host factor-I protein|nr:MAG: RNA chaperone Hfq [Deltaproteobacteria bacterium HGW-Deltaproteobacteria-23]